VRDLLNNQISLTSTILVWPNAIEHLPEDGVEWLYVSIVHLNR
jgi:hypothetical protein